MINFNANIGQNSIEKFLLKILHLIGDPAMDNR